MKGCVHKGMNQKYNNNNNEHVVVRVCVLYVLFITKKTHSDCCTLNALIQQT